MEQYKFSPEEIKNVAHTFAMQATHNSTSSQLRTKTAEYIKAYVQTKEHFEKYNATGELPQS